MQVTFYTFAKKINSTARPSSGGTALNCQLKQPTGTSNPVLIVQGFNFSWNYCYIPAWGRYYFFDEPTILTGVRVEIQCSCDVLATYKTNIQSYNAFVERSASRRTEFVNDGLVSNTLDIVSQSEKDTALPEPFSMTGSYILRVVNDTSSPTGLATYSLSASDLKSVFSFMFNDGSYGDSLKDQIVKTFFNPFQYVVSLMWIPISYDWLNGKAGTIEAVQFGWWKCDHLVTRIDHESYTGFSMQKAVTLPSNIYSDFRKYHPAFSSYYIYLPGLGTFPMNASEIENGISVTLTIDVISGVGMYTLTETADGSAGNVIATYKFQAGVPVQIGQVSANVNSIAGDSTAGISSAVSGNYAGAALSGFNAVQNITSPTPSVNGTQGGKYILTAFSQVRVTCLNYGSCDIPNTVAGRPLNRNITLSNLSGFCKCAGASVPIAGYSGEKEAVDNYLNEGFYLE